MIGRTASFVLIPSLLLLAAVSGCRSAPTADTAVVSSWSSVSPVAPIPLDVTRLAVLFPKTYDRTLMDAYARLESAALTLKVQRPLLRIVDRFDLPTIRSEQAFQSSGAVSDETAIGVGRLLGADSILFYRIESPTLRDRVRAKLYGGLPPVTVTSKIVRVATAEVVYHNVVTVPVRHDGDYFRPPLFGIALDRSVTQTIADLQRAFR